MFKNDTDLLDQHFLVDENVVDKFIELAQLNENDRVIEVGPGNGVLTRRIYPKVKSLTIIEKDQRLISNLQKVGNINIINNNCLNINLDTDKIITSLPYSIIEPFMYKMINTKFDTLYMIMGKTYVDNVMNKKITNLSLLTNTFFDVDKVMDIPKDAFNPMPNTISSMVIIKHKKQYSNIDKILSKMYLLDDKKVKNSLMESFVDVFNYTKKEAKMLIKELEIDNVILESKFSTISNSNLEILYKKIIDKIY